MITINEILSSHKSEEALYELLMQTISKIYFLVQKLSYKIVLRCYHLCKTYTLFEYEQSIFRKTPKKVIILVVSGKENCLWDKGGQITFCILYLLNLKLYTYIINSKDFIATLRL